MGSSASICGSIPDCPVKWFLPNSPDSLHWRNMTSFFGSGRNKSFRRGSMVRGSTFNRKGNTHGELSGRLVFYNKASPKTDYSILPKTPRLCLMPDSKVFAKAFFDTTLSRMPVGENNLGGAKGVRGHGPALLAMVPRACAIFLEVNDTPVEFNEFCIPSAKETAKAQRQDSADPGDEQPPFLDESIEGSLVTFLLSRKQDDYSFMHFPLLANFHDALFPTGQYGHTMVRSFFSVVNSLRMGIHKLNMRVYIYYDHSSFGYFPLDKNINAIGLWHTGLSNRDLKSPHPHPLEIVTTESPLAEGVCLLEVHSHFDTTFRHLLDCKPPKEVYNKPDINEIRKEAKLVASKEFGKKLKVEGPPNSLVLTSHLQQRRMRDQDTGYRYHYDYIEFSALWYNRRDQVDPHALGYMVKGCMARGEIKPRRSTKDWTCYSVQDENHRDIQPRTYRVQNKYIWASNAVRRRSTWAAAAHKAAMLSQVSQEFLNLVRGPNMGRRITLGNLGETNLSHPSALSSKRRKSVSYTPAATISESIPESTA